jgi:threonine dehydratase
MPTIPTDDAIEDARSVLRRFLPVTPLIDAPQLTARLGQRVLLKMENALPTGSFKPRGALYALSCAMRQRHVADVVASSTGNHGAAVAFAARELGTGATIFLPENANPIKRARIQELGARIVVVGTDLAAAAEAAREYATVTGAYFLDDATDDALPAGPATIATEIFEQAPDTRTIFVPVGDSALIRGVAAVARRRGGVRIIGVQAELAPSYYLSWKADRVVRTETCATMADGLATRTPVADNVTALRQLVDAIVLVSEAELLAAMKALLVEENVLAEPAGAAATAAALATGGVTGPTVLLVTGANVSPDVRALLEDGPDGHVPLPRS